MSALCIVRYGPASTLSESFTKLPYDLQEHACNYMALVFNYAFNFC